MRIAVKDANVLIDMAVAGLLESWFQLGISTCTKDILPEDECGRRLEAWRSVP